MRQNKTKKTLKPPKIKKKHQNQQSDWFVGRDFNESGPTKMPLFNQPSSVLRRVVKIQGALFHSMMAGIGP